MKNCLTLSNDGTEKVVILEINFSLAGKQPINNSHLLWVVLGHIAKFESPACVVLVSETSMWQVNYSGAYFKFLQKLASLFPKTTLFYYGKEVDNTLSVDQAKFLNCLPVSSWEDASKDVISTIIGRSHPTWYCFSHRMSSSALFRKIVKKNIIEKLSMDDVSIHIYSPDDVSRYFDLDVTQLDIKITAALRSTLIANTSKELTFYLFEAAMKLLKDRRPDSPMSSAWNIQRKKARDSISYVKEISSSEVSQHQAIVSSPEDSPYQVFVTSSSSHSSSHVSGRCGDVAPQKPSSSLSPSFNSPLVRSRKHVLKSEAVGCDNAVSCSSQ